MREYYPSEEEARRYIEAQKRFRLTVSLLTKSLTVLLDELPRFQDCFSDLNLEQLERIFRKAAIVLHSFLKTISCFEETHPNIERRQWDWHLEIDEDCHRVQLVVTYTDENSRSRREVVCEECSF